MEGLARQFADAAVAAIAANPAELSGMEVTRTGLDVKVAFGSTSTPVVDIDLSASGVPVEQETQKLLTFPRLTQLLSLPVQQAALVHLVSQSTVKQLRTSRVQMLHLLMTLPA